MTHFAWNPRAQSLFKIAVLAFVVHVNLIPVPVQGQAFQLGDQVLIERDNPGVVIRDIYTGPVVAGSEPIPPIYGFLFDVDLSPNQLVVRVPGSSLVIIDPGIFLGFYVYQLNSIAGPLPTITGVQLVSSHSTPPIYSYDGTRFSVNFSGLTITLADAFVFRFTSLDGTGSTGSAIPSIAHGGTSPGKMPPVLVTDVGAITSLLFSSVPTSLAQRELALGSSVTTLHDFNGRLFRHRAGLNGGDGQLIDHGPDGMTYHTVTIGEGDGIEPVRGGKGTKVVVGVPDSHALRWEVFTSFDYGNFDLDANKNFLGLRSDTYAETIGVERCLTKHLLAGAGVSYLESYSDQSTDVDGLTLAAYLTGTWGGLYADVLYGATLLDHDIDRDTGLDSTAHADLDSVVHGVNFNTGYNLYVKNWSTGFFAGVDYAHAELDGYTERGGGTAAAKLSEQSVDSLITRLGWQVTYRKRTSWGAITPQVRVSWERENLDSDDELHASLVKSPYYLVQGNTISSTGAAFNVTVPGQERKRDYMIAGAGVRVDFGPSFHMMVDYDGYFFDEGYTAHFGRLTAGWRF